MRDDPLKQTPIWELDRCNRIYKLDRKGTRPNDRACGCIVRLESTPGPTARIEYCTLHGAAFKLLEACEAILLANKEGEGRAMEYPVASALNHASNLARKAIAEVKGVSQ